MQVIKTMHQTYKYFRKAVNKTPLIGKLFPLSENQKNMWEDCGPIWKENNAIPIINQCDSEISIECIHFFEIFPKEKLDSVFDGLLQMSYKFRDVTVFHYLIDDNTYDMKNNFLLSKSGWKKIGGFNVKKGCNLSRYIASIQFKFLNITDSFFFLKITIILNKELKNSLENYLKSNVISQEEVFISTNTRYRDFYNLGTWQGSGMDEKYNNFANIITDIIWNVSKEIGKYIDLSLLQSNMIPPRIIAVHTNILSTMNIDDMSTNITDEMILQSPETIDYINFWYSIGITPLQCKPIKKNTAYLIYDIQQGLYIYDRCNSNHIENEKNSNYIKNELGEEYGVTVLPKALSDYIKLELFNYSQIFSKSKRMRKHLKLHLKLVTYLAPMINFLKEFINLSKSELKFWQSNNTEYNSFSSQIIKPTLLIEYYNNCIEIYKNKTSVITAIASRRLSITVLLLTILSVILGIALFFSDEAKCFVNYLCT